MCLVASISLSPSPWKQGCHTIATCTCKCRNITVIINTTQGLLVAALGSIGMLIAIMMTPHNKENTMKRLGKCI